jgi:CheY-like chemotaxis protein
MEIRQKMATILMAEDDPDDRLLIMDAFKETQLPNNLRFVDDGRALMDYLLHRNHYKTVEAAPRPSLILLDLNMPGKDGRQALVEIKADPNLRKIPVVVLSTSSDRQDILESYAVGASSFIAKPVSFDKLVDIIKTLVRYWLEMVELPI